MERAQALCCSPCRLPRSPQVCMQPSQERGRRVAVLSCSRSLASAETISRCREWRGWFAVPEQALVRERIKDWGGGLCKALGKRLVELTGARACCNTQAPGWPARGCVMRKDLLQWMVRLSRAELHVGRDCTQLPLHCSEAALSGTYTPDMAATCK